MSNLSQQVIIITGAATGIGRAIAKRFGHDGYLVIVADIDTEKGYQVVTEINDNGGDAIFQTCDITQPDQIKRLVNNTLESYSALHVLINNAWTGSGLKPLEEKTDEDFQHALDGGLFAARRTMNAALPTMRAQGFGRIINLCSLNGVNAHPLTSDYNVSKEALRCLTRTAAREWAPYGITVNAICPAAVTPAFEAMQASAPQMARRVVKQIPMGYMGDPERDIAGVAAFLAGDEARYITGNTLFVDGGSHINGISWASLFDDNS